MEKERLIEVVTRARQGDESAKEALYLDAYLSVYRFALRLVKNPEDAEDITQEVFIKVNEKITELREAPAFYKWVNQITVNKCNELLRKYKGIASLDDEEEFIALSDDDPLNLPDRAIDDEATRKIIMDVIDALPDGQRACVLYYYYSQYTIAQIADMLEINEGTVKSRLSTARAKIRAALEEKEKKEGIKLYGIPLALTPILRQAIEQMSAPDGLAERLWENIRKAASSNTLPDSSQNVPKSGTGGAASATVKTGMTLATKIIIGVVAAAVVTAGVIFLPPLFNSPDDTTSPGVTDTSPTQPGTETPGNTQGVTDPSHDVSSEPPTTESDTSPEPPTTQPPVLPVDPNAHGNSVGNITNSGLVAIQGDRIYYRNFSDGRKLYSMKTDGSDKQKLNDEDSCLINVIGDRIYYQSFNDRKFYSMKIDGSDKQKLVDDYAGYSNVVGDRIYYQSFNDGGKIYSMNTDGTDRKKLNDDNSYYINVVGDRIYYTIENDGGNIYSMNTDGSDRKKLNDDHSIYVNVVGDRIYYRNYDDGSKLYSIKIDGSDRKKLTDAESWWINVVGDTIYYCNMDDGSKIYSMKTNGSDKQKLNDDASDFINVIGDRIYYCCDYGAATEKLYSMNTDGTDRQLVD